jgi:hypothetical protein
MQDADGFIPDGCDRLRSTHEPQIRAEIELKYADQLASASWLTRRKIRKRIKHEIDTRLDDLAPPEALY